MGTPFNRGDSDEALESGAHYAHTSIYIYMFIIDYLYIYIYLYDVKAMETQRERDDMHNKCLIYDMQ